MANTHDLTDAEYEDLAYKELGDAEGNILYAYYDSKGIPTIGIGINLENSAYVDDVAKLLGVDPDTAPPVLKKAEMGFLSQLEAAGSKLGPVNTSPPERDAVFDKIMAQRAANEGLTAPKSFSITAAQSELLFKNDSLPAEAAKLNALIGLAALPESNERLALLSLVYNGVTPTQTIAAYEAGNRAQAWYLIRYVANGGDPAYRRYFESQLFDLYGEDADPTAKGNADLSKLTPAVALKTALDIYRMYSLNRAVIDANDKKNATAIVAQDAKQFANTGILVQSWADAFKPAYDYLVSKYAGGISIDEKNIYAAAANASGTVSVSKPNAGSYMIIGGDSGGDSGGTIDGVAGVRNVLVGGKGKDTILGGAENDRIWSGAGNDTIDGGGGDDTVVFVGAAIDYDIVHNKNGSWTISDVRGDKSQGTDTLKNVEHVEFDGVTKALSSDAKSGGKSAASVTADDTTQTFALQANGITDQTDLALVIDTTASMGPYIDGVKTQAVSLIGEAFKSGQQDTHIGIVSFKDSSEGDPNTVLLDFTQQDSLADREKAATDVINGITVGGGGDIPEEDNHGLLLALNGSMGQWRDSAAIRRIVLFTDAPVKDTDLAGQVDALAANLGVAVTSGSISHGTGGSFANFSLKPGANATASASAFTLQIFTVALGSDSTAAADLSTIASATGGQAFTAADGDALATALMQIINLPPQPLITSNGGGGSATIKLNENVKLVTQVVADDPDPDATLTFSIAGGDDAGLFKIDAKSGQLSFLSAPNFEAPADADRNNVYNVVVSASNGTLSDSQTLAVAVGNVNEAPIITSFGGQKSVALNTVEKKTAVATILASDPDAGTALSFAIVPGGDASLFKIDPKKGLLTFKTPPNFDAPQDAGRNNNYQVTVSASDGKLVATQILTITVLNDFGATNGNDLIKGTTGGDIINALAGNDVIYGNGGVDLINAGDGDDTVFCGAGNANVAGGTGDDLLLGGAGGNTLSGDSGNDMLVGGNNANNVLIGGADDDVLIGGTGGRNTFEFGAAFGQDVVTNFAQTDVLRFTPDTGVLNFVQAIASMSQVGNNALFTLSPGNTITLDNVNIAGLTTTNFRFG